MKRDTTIRDLLRSQSFGARKSGLIAETYQANPAMCAALALDATKGNTVAAMAIVETAMKYLVAVAKEDQLPIVASPPMAANDEEP